jgi:PAS domain S-box-containing protein
MKNNITKVVPFRWHLIFIISIISALLTIGGYWYFDKEKEKICLSRENSLAAIGKLKIDRIEDWYKDELHDAHSISKNRFLIETVNEFMTSGSSKDKDRLSDYLRQIKIEHNFSDVFIASSEGGILASWHEQKIVFSEVEQQFAKMALNSGKGVSTSLFQSTYNGNDAIYISFISSIEIEEKDEFLALICRIDPNQSLYPLVESWPVPSLSAETFIFSVNADSILYLNNLRHETNTALHLKIPLSQTTLPAAKAAAGHTGMVAGKDYRDVDVVAYVGRIEGTPWYLVSKIDSSELYAELPVIMMRVVGFVLFGILFAGFVVGFVYNILQKSRFKELYQKEKEIWQQQEKFKVTMDSLGDGVIITDTNARIQYMNSVAEELTGWKFGEAKDRLLEEVYALKNEDTGQKENNIMEKVIEQGIVKELANHTLLISKSGKEIPILDTGAPIFDSDDSILGVVITFQDETEKRKQRKLIIESEVRFRSSLDNLIEGCQIINSDFTYLYLNKAAIESSHKTKEELIGKTMMECYPGIEETKMFSKLKLCLEKKIPHMIENEFTYPDGDKRVFNLRFEPVPEGAFILSEDITAAKIDKDFILKFKMGIDLSGEAIFLTDKEGVITYVNPAFERIFGYSSEEAIGNTPRLIKSGQLSSEDYKKLWSTLLIKKPVKHEIVNKTKDNKLLYIEASINPIINDKDEVIGYLAIERDITERKIAEKARMQLTAIIDATPDFIGTADLLGRPIYINNAGRKMAGLELDEDLSGLNISDFHPDWAGQTVLNIGLPAAIKNGTWHGETAILHRDGSLKPVSQMIIAHKSNDGKVEYFSTMSRDITERKKMIDELIIEKEKAEASDKLKSAFLNNISHEIRTPLNGILGFGQLLVSPNLSNDEREEYYSHVENSSFRLMNTVTDYLDMALIYSSTMEVNKNDLRFDPFFKSLLENAETQCKAKGLLLEADIPADTADLVIHTDKEFVQKIFNILLSNALKFTEKGNIICGYKFVPDYLEIFVKDTGKGIEADKLELIFNMFMQEDVSITRGHEGSGLGLTIAKGLVKLLGGAVFADSVKGKGSTFSFSIPFGDKQTTMVENLMELPSKHQIDDKITILIAEDDEFNYLYMQSVMKSIGCKHIHAVNGAEAVEKCKQNPDINLILMDIKMPVMNGIEATKLIREFKSDLPIIATTAYAQTGDEQRFLEAGFSDYLAKPINMKQLKTIIQKHV